MGQTRFFDLAFFDFGDQLDSALNVQKEIDRFVVIDKQLYGLYNVFGSGVISGWAVTDNGFSAETGISALVSPGLGIIKFIASETSLPSFVNNIPANSIVDIFAVLTGSTPRDRSVNFIASQSGITSVSAIKIARITTGDNGILLIDNEVRDLVGFKEIIKDEISKHKHRGSPSKIDLKEETKNQLPGARIEEIAASQITSGVFDINRIPLLDHNEIENTGILTHAALDTFTRALSQNNKELLGEIASVNLLRSIIFLKQLFPDVDEHFINELALIPGISPNNFIDFDASTANIDLADKCISGVPVKTGLFSSIFFDDNFAFFNAQSKTNIIIENDTVFLERSGEDIDIIEDFDHNIAPGDSIPGFELEIISTKKHIKVISDATDTNKVEGDFSGVFNATNTVRAVYTKLIDPAKTWTDKFDELVIFVKTNTLSHEAVFGYLVTLDGEDEKIGTIFEILSKDEVTSNSDRSKNNFKEIIIDITKENVENVVKLVIFTDDLGSNFSFTLDNIHVRRTDLVSPSGSIRFRHVSQTTITFYSLFYEAVVPDETNISVRVKVASSEALLPRAVYGFPLSSGDIFALNGSAIEIEVSLTTTDLTVSPILEKVELRLLADSDFSGFILDSETDWNRGVLENITTDPVSTISSDLVLTPEINVNGFSFSIKNSVSEIDSNSVGLFGFSGSKMPISPVQGLNWNLDPFKRFKNVRSAQRRFTKNFIVADTYNDRVVEVDKKGNLIKGFGSSYSTDTKFYPLSSVYNKNTNIFSIVFTKQAVIQDISKISLIIGTISTPLIENEDIVQTGQKSGGKILEIKLGSKNSIKLLNVTSNLFVDFEEGAFPMPIEFGDNASKLSGLFGMTVFIGNFTYMDGIRHPVYADTFTDNTWMVANSSIFYSEPIATGVTLLGSQENTTVPGVLEFNTDTLETIYTTDSIIFSDFTLGSIMKFSSNKILVAGLRSGSTITSGLSGSQLIEKLVPSGEQPGNKLLFRAAALDALSGHRGVVAIIDKLNGNVQNFYLSQDGNYPSSVDLFTDGEVLVAESGFAEATGKLITLDQFGTVINMQLTGTVNVVNGAKVLPDKGIVVSV